uniref:hypothetical protein n=1 Tax=Halomonas sp. TaxID=1486246 RepID=UPI00261D7629
DFAISTPTRVMFMTSSPHPQAGWCSRPPVWRNDADIGWGGLHPIATDAIHGIGPPLRLVPGAPGLAACVRLSLGGR